MNTEPFPTKENTPPQPRSRPEQVLPPIPEGRSATEWMSIRQLLDMPAHEWGQAAGEVETYTLRQYVLKVHFCKNFNWENWTIRQKYFDAFIHGKGRGIEIRLSSVLTLEPIDKIAVEILDSIAPSGGPNWQIQSTKINSEINFRVCYFPTEIYDDEIEHVQAPTLTDISKQLNTQLQVIQHSIMVNS